VNLSVACPQVAKDFGFGPATMGVLFSCVLYSYILLLAPMGMLADRWAAAICRPLACSSGRSLPA
jgi:sugar phosphate permease